MFLTKTSAFDQRKLTIAAAVVAVFCIAGVLWLDYPLLVFLRSFDGLWARMIDVVFSFKVWIAAVSVALAVQIIIKSKEQRAKSIDRERGSFVSYIKESTVKFKRVSNSALCSLLFALVLSGMVGWVLKVAIGRMRPVFFEALDKVGFYPFTMDWAFNSMPSGHAVASFAGLVTIGLLHPRWKPLTWSLAILIGISRVAAGAHFPSDVLLGAFIGMACADIIAALRQGEMKGQKGKRVCGQKE